MAEKTFKIAIIGDCGVGKTAFVEKYRTGDYNRVYNPSKNILHA
jgi:GTPase SAR1 family protein